MNRLSYPTFILTCSILTGLMIGLMIIGTIRQ